MGTLPATAYLLIDCNEVVGEFANKTAIARHFGIFVSDDGRVTFNGELVYPSYIMSSVGQMVLGNHFKSKEEVISDWSRSYLEKNLPRDCSIYRFLT